MVQILATTASASDRMPRAGAGRASSAERKASKIAYRTRSTYRNQRCVSGNGKTAPGAGLGVPNGAPDFSDAQYIAAQIAGSTTGQKLSKGASTRLARLAQKPFDPCR